MIDVNEIKIGNWFHHNVSMWSYRNDDGKLSNFNDNFQWNESDWYNLGECTLSLDVVEPIELTEEWHNLFGVKKDGFHEFTYDISRFEKGKLCLVFSGDYLYLRESEKPNTIPSDIICIWNKDLMKHFYVHEFQNLYKSITGNELKSKINEEEL